MAAPKTKPTEELVGRYIESIGSEERRRDCRLLQQWMQQATGEPGRMWSSGMVGFGTYHYPYASGHQGNWFVTGFANRKQALTLYIMSGFSNYPDLLSQLGKYKTGKSCQYVKHLSDVDQQVLRMLIEQSVAYMRKTYP